MQPTNYILYYTPQTEHVFINPQVQGDKSRECEPYVYYGERSLDADNAVDEGFET